jgi:hypothetical protein
MKKDYLIVIVFFAAAFLYIYLVGGMKIKITGDSIYVKTTQARTILEKSGEYQQRSYLVVGTGLNHYDYFVVEMPVIPLGKVDQLTAKYGDFRNCNSAGANEGKNCTVEIRLIGINQEVNRAISKIYSKSRRLDGDFKIKLSAAPLKIIKHDAIANRVNYIGAPAHEDFLVKDISLLDAQKN